VKRAPIKKLTLPVRDGARWRAYEKASDIARAMGRSCRSSQGLERLAALDARGLHKLDALEGLPRPEVIGPGRFITIASLSGGGREFINSAAGQEARNRRCTQAGGAQVAAHDAGSIGPWGMLN
jgi:hypothetical protein